MKHATARRSMRLLCALLLAAILLLSASVSTFAAAWNGTDADTSWYNTTDTVFELSDGADLAGLADTVNGTDTTYTEDTFLGKTVKLTADIDLGSKEWKGIGASYDFSALSGIDDAATFAAAAAKYGTLYSNANGSEAASYESGITYYAVTQVFCGTFDGQGHAVKNLSINQPATSSDYPESYSLFRTLGSSGTIKNLSVTGKVDAARRAAGIVGTNFGTVESCTSAVSVTANGGGSVRGSGGIVGTNHGGTITACYNTGSVYNAYRRAGGIAGYNYGGTITACYNIGYISSANATYSGGIAATNANWGSHTATIQDSYWLKDSVMDGVAWWGQAENGYAFVKSGTDCVVYDAAGTETTDSLQTKLNAAAAGAYIEAENAIDCPYPVLSWQEDYSWPAVTINLDASTAYLWTVTDAAGTTVAAGESVYPGTVLNLSATIQDSNYLLANLKANGSIFYSAAPTTMLSSRYGVGTATNALLFSATITPTGGTAVFFAGVPLTQAQLAAYSRTYTIPASGSESAYLTGEITGVTFADLIEHYLDGDYTLTALRYTASDSSSRLLDWYAPTVTRATVNLASQDWSKVWLIWQAGDEELSGLRIVIQGNSNGWASLSGVVSVTDSTELVFDGYGLSRDALKSVQDVTGASWGGKTVNGASFDAIIELIDSEKSAADYPALLLDSKARDYQIGMTSSGSSVIFSKEGRTPIEGAGWSDYTSVAAVWYRDGDLAKLRSAMNLSGGWLSIDDFHYVAKATSTVTINPSPAAATVVVKDSKDQVVAPVSGTTYLLSSLEQYTVSASAANHTSQSKTFVALADRSIGIALVPTSGGGSSGYTITGYSGSYGTVTANVSHAEAGAKVVLTVNPAAGYKLSSITAGTALSRSDCYLDQDSYSFTMPAASVTVQASFEPIVLKIYTQKGAEGTPVRVAAFSYNDLHEDLSTTHSNGYGYLFYKNDAWQAVVATEYVTTSDLMSAAELSLTSKDSVKADDGSGYYAISAYSLIKEANRFFDPFASGASTVVPDGLAIQWASGELANAGSFASLATAAYYSGSLRYVYGSLQADYQAAAGDTVRGARSCNGVKNITLIKDASVTGDAKGVTGDGSQEVTAAVNVSDAAVTAAITAAGKGKSVLLTPSGEAKADEYVAISGAAAAKIIANESALHAKVANGTEMRVSLATLKQLQLKASDVLALTMARRTTTGNAVIDNLSSKGALAYDLFLTVNGKKQTLTEGTIEVEFSNEALASMKAPRLACFQDNGAIVGVRVTRDGNTLTGQIQASARYLIVEEADFPLAFTDVAASSWYNSSVRYAVANGLFNGTAAKAFSPSATMTRAMLVTVLYRAADMPAVTASTRFTDVADASAYYYDAVAWAEENGIVTGYGNGVFGPNDSITREQLALFLYRFAVWQGADVSAEASLSSYTDVAQINTWADTAMQWANHNGIVTGVTTTTLSPLRAATRAEVAVMLARFGNLEQ